jgi:hypothetical protein
MVMKSTMAIILLASSAVFGAQATEPSQLPTTPLSDSQRIDYLILQNQLLAAEIQRLRVESERPTTKEEAFAACMQAAKGQTSPMAAESIGGHCDLILKK